ncbi:MAG: YihA family ribosome biogenesis GTP-binding protein [Bacilli bacterium]|nr:YihA family ribosome biogenesis GTP-binding protein [Bacilli bacterium]
MINFNNSTFVKSAPSLEEAPKAGYPEVLIVGKSNVGKSSLINSLCERKQLAFTSSKPGHTKLLNYYNIDNRFYLVDAPGYGYAKGGVDLDALFGNMMSTYFEDNEKLKLVLLLIDSRREFGENDLEILNYVQEKQIPYYIVVTKVDKVNQSEKAKFLKHLNSVGVENNITFLTSSLIARSLNPLRGAIEKAL